MGITRGLIKPIKHGEVRRHRSLFEAEVEGLGSTAVIVEDLYLCSGCSFVRMTSDLSLNIPDLVQYLSVIHSILPSRCFYLFGPLL